MSNDLSFNETVELIKRKYVPQHVAIIMDGNGRWAKAHGFIRSVGHRYGMEKIIELLRTSKQIGVKYVTVYAFSTENWSRPKEEVDTLMKLIVEFIYKEIDELKSEGARVHVLGDYSICPEESRKAIDFALDTTKENDQLHFNIALNYGGRAELVKAVKSISQKVACGELSVDDISEKLISESLYTAGMPDPDLIIRTAGEMRLSNFLTYQSAYSEIWISPKELYWPDFNKECYLKAIMEFQKRERRFGGIENKNA